MRRKNVNIIIIHYYSFNIVEIVLFNKEIYAQAL